MSDPLLLTIFCCLSELEMSASVLWGKRVRRTGGHILLCGCMFGQGDVLGSTVGGVSAPEASISGGTHHKRLASLEKILETGDEAGRLGYASQVQDLC